MKQLQLIEESYTCLDKPLLEYVYEVDNYFLPDYLHIPEHTRSL